MISESSKQQNEQKDIWSQFIIKTEKDMSTDNDYSKPDLRRFYECRICKDEFNYGINKDFEGYYKVYGTRAEVRRHIRANHNDELNLTVKAFTENKKNGRYDCCCNSLRWHFALF